MAVEIYRNLIIGSGEGGKSLAWHLAGAGGKTAVVERRCDEISKLMLAFLAKHAGS